MDLRLSLGILVALGLSACGGSSSDGGSDLGGSGGGGGGGGGGGPTGFVNFQIAADIVGQTTSDGATANNGAGVGLPNQIGLDQPSGHVGIGPFCVADSQNHRVLGWNAVVSGLGQPADFVLGQGVFTTRNMGTNGAGLNLPTSCWFAAGALFVVDQNNGRVLLYGLPFTTGKSASVALGKPNLTTTGITSGQAGLGLPADVCVAANRVVVADRLHNRVMVWNGIPAASGANADLVLGQPDFGTTAAGPSAGKMNAPTGVWTDGTRLAVADMGNNRVLVWTTFPTANGQTPDLVVGQPDLSTVLPGTGAQGLDNPESVASDGTQLFVADRDNNRVLLFSPFPTASNPVATGVLGQSTFTNVAPNDDDQDGTPDGAPTARTLSGVNGVTALGTQLFVADKGNHRVLVFTRP